MGTGAWIRDLEKADDPLVGIEFHRHDSKLLFGCSTKGTVIVWKWMSGVKEKRIQLQLESSKILVQSFNVIPNDDMETEGDTQHALVTYLDESTNQVMVQTFDLDTGKVVTTFDVALHKNHKIAISKYNFFAAVHKNFLNIGFFRNETVSQHKNKTRSVFSCISCHPSEPIIATGDVEGQIRLWRDVHREDKIMCTLYHWHATPVNTIAFSEFGGNFYSGAREFVLVKWTIDRPETKQFLPRLRGSPLQITLGPKNNNIALALSDNQVQLLDSNFELSATVQTFTFVHDDSTGLERFPAGIRLNPRNQCLVLNGRVGQLQFYSTQSQSLLYSVRNYRKQMQSLSW